MALDKQIYIYGIDTSAFYNKDEERIHNNLNKLYFLKRKLSDKVEKINKSKDKDLDENKKIKQKINIIISRINRRIKKKKDKLYGFLNKNQEIRHLNPKFLNKRNIISVFESTLTRTLQLSTNSLSVDIMVVQTYFFKVIEDIILDGYFYNNEKYVCLTASAGQIRTKKTVFIKEKLLLKHQNTLMCGLTIDDINKQGGVNVNKYLAYLALSNSATDKWEDFDIDKAIVVEDMETTVRGLVDFIDDKTYEITRQEMDIPICHTDGCGMFLPKVNNKSFMVRLPWIKGLLVPFPYDKFIEEYNCSPVIKDIYGKEYNIVEDDIQIIFTKSQFKMWKYYKSWQQYKDNYKKYKCHAGKCNEEEDEFEFAKLNYQMLQTLVDISDKELQIICKRTKNNILRIGHDRKTMLKVLGVTKANINKNYFQQAIELYPELLNDTYSKEILKSVKKKMVKEARAAKLDINGKYTFIIPDLFSFCEFLFLGDKNPKGLLENGEVYCNLYKDKLKLNCLRSPHLYMEWTVRNNVVDDEKCKWFITNGLYTSCHDLISKILQFDKLNMSN